MKIGAAQVDITPDRPVDLSGFAARTQPSTGAIDAIYAKCIVLDDGSDRRFLWLHADLIAFGGAFVREFRDWVKSALDIPEDHVLLSATHTHSGPQTVALNGCGRIDDGYMLELMQRCQQAAKAAHIMMFPGRVTIGRSKLELAIDRRKQASSHVDPWVTAIAFHDEQENCLAVIVNYAMHPVALGHVNRKVSADWCGATASHIASSLPDNPIVLVTNGAAGNINPPAEGVSAEVVYGFGQRVAEAALNGLRTARRPEANLKVVSRTVPIDLDLLREDQIDPIADRYMKTCPPGSSWEKPFAEALTIWRASRREDLASGLRTIDIELQVVQIGDLFAVAVNGEMFSRFTDLVREKSGRELFTVAYANRAFGYIPTDAAYDEGGYEVETAHFFYNSFRPKRGALELLADRAASLIREMAQ